MHISFFFFFYRVDFAFLFFYQEKLSKSRKRRRNNHNVLRNNILYKPRKPPEYRLCLYNILSYEYLVNFSFTFKLLLLRYFVFFKLDSPYMFIMEKSSLNIVQNFSFSVS